MTPQGVGVTKSLPGGPRGVQSPSWPAGGACWICSACSSSITLGGFGADRFYLGQWREGLGKLFSFGGLGVWTLLDVLLIGVGYVGPADGSLYI